MAVKVNTKWTEKMQLQASSGQNEIRLDAKAPLGQNLGMTPKELLVVSVCGCTAMDVIALMKKHKQPVEFFDVRGEATMTEGVHPAVFTRIDLVFELKGNLDKEKVIESVRLSQTKYCGVSAMVAKAAPIYYKILLNDQEIATGEAQF